MFDKKTRGNQTLPGEIKQTSACMYCSLQSPTPGQQAAKAPSQRVRGRKVVCGVTKDIYGENREGEGATLIGI